MPLRREWISTEFLDRLFTLISRGESVVIAGPRHGGKSFLIRKVMRDLEKIGTRPLKWSFYTDYAIEDERAAIELLRQNHQHQWMNHGTFGAAFDEFRTVSEKGLGWTTLVISHLDGLDGRVARPLLRHIRAGAYAQPQAVVALITCESPGISDMVTGPDSEFNCAHEFVVQGFDRSIFAEWFAAWMKNLNLQFVDDQMICDYLWKETHGNASLMRRVLHSCADHRVVEDVVGPYVLDDLKNQVDRLVRLGTHSAVFLQRAAELVTSMPSCWEQLEHLIEEGFVPFTEPKPTHLELAGVAIAEGDSLVFSSPIMRRFVERQFDRRRMADLYALSGNWPKAQRRYSIPSGHLPAPRPVNFEDSLLVSAVLRRLYMQFNHHEAAVVKDILYHALRGVLGYTHVSYWTWRPGQKWRPADQATPDAIGRAAISGTTTFKVGETRPVTRDSGEAVGLILFSEGRHRGERHATIVADPLDSPASSKYREDLLREALQHFEDAWKRRLLDSRARDLKRFGSTLGEAARTTFEALFVRLADPGAVLADTAQQVTEASIGISRTSFLMLTESGQSFRPFISYPELPVPSRRTVIDGESAFKSVFATGPQVYEGIEDWPPSDRVWVTESGIGTSILVPIVTESRHNIGIMVIEASEALIIDPDVIGVLAGFATQLASAVMHSQRIALLDSSLDRLPMPIVIFNRQLTKQYANSAAASLIANVTKGWAPEIVVTEQTYPNLYSTLRDSVLENHQVVRFVTRLGPHNYRGAVVGAPLVDREGRVAGSLLQIYDQSYYREILDAYRVLEASHGVTEALGRVQQIFHALGASWIRKYRVEGDRLIPDTCIDPRRPDVKRVFETINSVTLPRRSEDRLCWAAINTGSPQVFCFDPGKEHGAIFYTSRGLSVTVYNAPPERAKLGKREGDFWIDFPLKGSGGPFGKLTLPCGSDFECELSPERFEMYGVFADIAGEVLKRIEKDRAAVQAMTSVRHNQLQREYADRCAPLAALYKLYETLASHDLLRGSHLQPANELFSEVLHGLYETVSAAKGTS